MDTVKEVINHISKLAEAENELAAHLGQTGKYSEANTAQRKVNLYKNLLFQIQTPQK